MFINFGSWQEHFFIPKTNNKANIPLQLEHSSFWINIIHLLMNHSLLVWQFLERRWIEPCWRGRRGQRTSNSAPTSRGRASLHKANYSYSISPKLALTAMDKAVCHATPEIFLILTSHYDEWIKEHYVSQRHDILVELTPNVSCYTWHDILNWHSLTISFRAKAQTEI